MVLLFTSLHMIMTKTFVSPWRTKQTTVWELWWQTDLFSNKLIYIKLNNLTPKKHKMICLNNCSNICRRIMEVFIWDVSISFDEIADCINHCTYNTGRNSSHSLIKIMGFQIEYNPFVFTAGYDRFVQEAKSPVCCIYSCSIYWF